MHLADSMHFASAQQPAATDRWIETSVKIHLPADGVKHPSEESAPAFTGPRFFYCCPLEVIKTAFCEASAEQFYFMSFETSFQASSNEPAKCVYLELYISPTMINKHCKIASMPRVNGCTLETVVASIMLCFGTVLLWPIYMYFGNQFKYVYRKLSCFVVHHLAYIPKFGIVIEFLDSICQQVFPYFFYLLCRLSEKTLLACIKFLAKYPCPCCLVPKAKIGELGTCADRHCHEQDAWFGTIISSIFVKHLLGPESLIATASAFSTQLAQFGFKFYSLFVPDLLHEFELRVWKAIFTHLLWMLYSYRNDTIQDLNEWHFVKETEKEFETQDLPSEEAAHGCQRLGRQQNKGLHSLQH
ncbi:hypothetical protein BDR06DRAFT_979649 [Suillus hirtellus]|nr:hypothetical protein BDR06DRAFT_979649 [Suillus hirtellus]